MKFSKFLKFLILTLLFVTNPAFAITEDTELQPRDYNENSTEANQEYAEESFVDDITKSDSDKAFNEKIECPKIELCAEKNKLVDNLKLNGAVQAFFDYSQPTDSADGSFNFTFLDTHLWVTGNPINENTNFKIMFNPLRDVSGYGGLKTIFSDVYIQTKTSQHTKLLIGQSRTPIGIDGSLGQYTLPFVYRSQIARNFSSIRALGIKHTGSYDFVDYNIGLYDSTRFLQNLAQGTEFTGWVNFKPLAKKPQYGKLVAGTGVNTGKRFNSYTVLGTYLGYEYKKFSANFEYADADGYNGTYNSTNKANGYYGTVAYFVHPKLQVLGRYDFYNPNKYVPKDNCREYTVGLNYYIKGEKIKLVANYIFHQNDNKNNSNIFLLMTQLLF